MTNYSCGEQHTKNYSCLEKDFNVDGASLSTTDNRFMTRNCMFFTLVVLFCFIDKEIAQ